MAVDQAVRNYSQYRNLNLSLSFQLLNNFRSTVLPLPSKMQFFTIIALLAPLALAETWNLSGTCSNDLTCEIDDQYTSSTLVCGNQNGHFSGEGNAGKTSCTPAGTKCTHVWTC
ncbi:hypothetical protein BDP81DRAFT_390646 [Colletotrichum phormii]|uniref:Uncharacterized protein n=1 Tax=Colletotrichum phormii TaxID=359342 RepID=A0AAJ0ELY9_9PEZI|nr:uncharacterized protein BDP81DRAFT_390646 [Colletotrichum phormii]KAK1641380.1 hypothetical protein BDP81DRAFT_390646 [Colletotrichum phormii]